MTAQWSIDSSGRFLRRDGEPWFLIGDTGWYAVRRLTRDEADHYLTVRAEQGFNTVLTVAVRGLLDAGGPNMAGETPFHDLDPARPNEAYWQHVDWYVRRANELGLTIGLLPTWGWHWRDAEFDGKTFFDPGNARAYTSWLARRYRDHDVIWVLGGDREVTTAAHRATIEEFAAGVREVVADTQLITFHPIGHSSSSDTFQDAGWVDFDIVQSGHTGWGTPNHQLIDQDYVREPVRPVLDGEPGYENHLVMTPPRHAGALWEEVEGWRFTDTDTRRAAYHATFAGAAGHVYGCTDITQMYDPHRDRTYLTGASIPWSAAVHLPGAVQMGHLGTFVREVAISEWEPDQSVIRSRVGFLTTLQRAMVRRSGAGAMVYAPEGREVRLDLRRWSGRSFTTRWWDPRDARWVPGPTLGEDLPTVPHAFPGRDGVLVLEAA